MSEDRDLDQRFLTGADPVPEPPTMDVIDWSTLDEFAAQAAFDELADWVDWLTRVFEIDTRTVPDCWPQHASMIWDLATLHTSWLGAFRVPRKAGEREPSDWHQQFAQTRVRLTDWTARSGCRSGTHRS